MPVGDIACQYSVQWKQKAHIFVPASYLRYVPKLHPHYCALLFQINMIIMNAESEELLFSATGNIPHLIKSQHRLAARPAQYIELQASTQYLWGSFEHDCSCKGLPWCKFSSTLFTLWLSLISFARWMDLHCFLCPDYNSADAKEHGEWKRWWWTRKRSEKDMV